MADFRTHITFSTTLGIAYGTLGYLQYELPLGNCVIAGGLCSLAGMLPDLDSDSGVPVRELKLFTSAVIPMLLMERFQRLGMSHASMVIAGGAVYAVIRFFVWDMFRKYTKHRGMWHSLPAAIIAALLAFLLSCNPDLSIRLYQSWAVLLGFLSHLFLDEMYSIDVNGRRLKKSFGTALKFWSPNAWANYTTYVKLMAVALLAINDPLLQQALESPNSRVPEFARKALQALQFDEFNRWLPHDHATHQEFNQRTMLPIHRSGYETQRRAPASADESGSFVQWFNTLTGRTREGSSSTPDPAVEETPTESREMTAAQPNPWPVR